MIEPDPNFGYENEAVRCIVDAGYGSVYDLSRLDFVVCDTCIGKGIDSGRIVESSWYEEMANDPEFQKEQSSLWEKFRAYSADEEPRGGR